MAENRRLDPRLDPVPSDLECKLSRPSLKAMLGRRVCPGTTSELVRLSMGLTLPLDLIPKSSRDFIQRALALMAPVTVEDGPVVGGGGVATALVGSSFRGFVSSVLASLVLFVAPSSLLHPADLGLLGAGSFFSSAAGACMSGLLSLVESSDEDAAFVELLSLLQPPDDGLSAAPDSAFVSLALLFALLSSSFVVPISFPCGLTSFCSGRGTKAEVSYGK